MKDKYKKIESVEELKKASNVDGGADFVLLLNYGLKSSKHISYSNGTFYIINLIDGSEQELTAEEIMDEKITLIGKGIEHKCFFQEFYK